MIRVYVQQVSGCACEGSNESISSMLSFGLEKRIAWLARFNPAVSFEGYLSDVGNMTIADRFLVLGSDHSVTTGIVSRIARYVHPQKVELIQFEPKKVSG